MMSDTQTHYNQGFDYHNSHYTIVKLTCGKSFWVGIGLVFSTVNEFPQDINSGFEWITLFSPPTLQDKPI